MDLSGKMLSSTSRKIHLLSSFTDLSRTCVLAFVPAN
jgi:hypothetical protein